MVMLGALIGSNSLFIDAASMRDTISKSTNKAFLDSNIKAFDLGMEAIKKSPDSLS